MPPSSPFSGRRRSSTAPSARTAQNATPKRVGFAARGAARRKSLGDAAGARLHGVCHGQSTQRGFCGTQMVAPKSITACA